MATKGFFTKRAVEENYALANFSNNLDVGELLTDFSVSAVDSNGDPAPSVLGASSIVANGTKVSFWYQAGTNGETYTFTIDVTTNLGAPHSLQVDMAVDDDGSYEDQLNDIETKIDAMQVDLDNPSQYQADVSALALETTAQSIKTKTDALPVDPASQADVVEAITNTEESIEEDLEVLQTSVDNLHTKADVIKAKTDTISWGDVEFIKAIEGGRWRIENYQMIFYDEDNITEVARFDLKNKQGAAADNNVFERLRVV